MASVFAVTRRRALACIALLAWPAGAVESDPLPVSAGTSREAAVRAYNAGVALLLERRYAEAQRQFERALQLDESLAEAHNNLAFSLRMQGGRNHQRSLLHYNRAIALQPGLAQAYMYRGMLFVQMGDLARARADHSALLQLDGTLAAQLLQAIEGRPPQERGGISGQYQ